MKRNTRKWCELLVVFLILGSLVMLHHVAWIQTVKTTLTWALVLITLILGIYHDYKHRQNKKAMKPIKDEKGIDEMQKLLESMKRNGIYLSPDRTERCEPLPVGISKYGGQPDVPAGFEWPRNTDGLPLSLLLQIDCATLATYDKEHLFPTTGHLYFFYELSEMDWDNEREAVKVIYNNAETQELLTAGFPEDLAEENRLKESALLLSAHECIPSYDDLFEINPLYSYKDTDLYEEAAKRIKLSPAPPENGSIGSLSGYAHIIQGSMLTDTPKNDILLMQLFTTEEEEEGIDPLMFGDDGNIYLYITREQLANLDFSHIRFELQCY